MAKATLDYVHEIPQDDDNRFFMCLATDKQSTNPAPIQVMYRVERGSEGSWLPEAGDTVQYFGDKISKIISRPVQRATRYGGAIRDGGYLGYPLRESRQSH